jgi:hypothetical protein
LRRVPVTSVSLLAIICALVVVLGTFLGPLRIVFAIVLLLVLPGYGVVQLLFVDQALDHVRTAVLTLALSIAIAILVTLVLNVFPGGLRNGTWAGALAVVTCAASALAARRRRPRPSTRRQLRRLGNRADVVLILLACAVLGATIGLATTPLQAANIRGYSALWIAAGSHARKPAVHLTIACVELHPTSYRLVIDVAGKQQRTIRNIDLRPGEQRLLSIPVRSAGGRVLVSALLFREANPFLIYRRTTLWLQTGPVAR